MENWFPFFSYWYLLSDALYAVRWGLHSQSSVDQYFFFFTNLLHGLAALVLTFALNHQRKFRAPRSLIKDKKKNSSSTSSPPNKRTPLGGNTPVLSRNFNTSGPSSDTSDKIPEIRYVNGEEELISWGDWRFSRVKGNVVTCADVKGAFQEIYQFAYDHFTDLIFCFVFLFYLFFLFLLVG